MPLIPHRGRQISVILKKACDIHSEFQDSQRLIERPFFKQTDRQSQAGRQKGEEKRNQVDLTDIYRTFYPHTKEYTYAYSSQQTTELSQKCITH